MNKVLVFNRNTQGNEHVSEHFQVWEFACKDGTVAVFIHECIPDLCEIARKINGPFSPNSAYRTPPHNAKEGGAANSYHVFGMAVDIPAMNATAQQLYDLFDNMFPNSMEIGIYIWGIHIGITDEKKRFRG